MYETEEKLMGSLPKPLCQSFDEQIEALRNRTTDCIIILDDDPTGTQTVYDIPVLTNWEISTIKHEIEMGSSIFFILTNSRSLPKKKAEELAQEIGANIKSATQTLGKKYIVVSRGDSTLRGHYPDEVYALEKGLEEESGVHFFIPAFFEGGRFTINDIHYVKEGDAMIPAAQTPFAKDKVFGYSSSNLKVFVLEKASKPGKLNQIHSLSLKDIREKTDEEILTQINGLQKGDVCIVNATEYSDLKRVFLSILKSNVKPVFRTAASFVSAMVAQPKKELLTGKELSLKKETGGLIIVGSYVPKSTQQLAHLQENTQVEALEINVEQLIEGKFDSPKEMAYRLDAILSEGKDVVFYTSRKLISKSKGKENLEIGEMISRFIAEVVKEISIQPRYMLAKGGITSSDIATKSLGVKRALVKGQIALGVPVWELGKESKFPGMPYIIFPGNVGDEATITNVVNTLKEGNHHV